MYGLDRIMSLQSPEYKYLAVYAGKRATGAVRAYPVLETFCALRLFQLFLGLCFLHLFLLSKMTRTVGNNATHVIYLFVGVL
jgi:hypothetical protein